MSREFLNIVEEIGKKVQLEWKRNHYNEEIFPEICSQFLSKEFQGILFDPKWIIEWILTDALSGGIQKDHDFSQLPLVLFKEENFYIELLSWTSGYTPIHEHAFVGAFRLMSGSSLHTTYNFLPALSINRNLSFGQLNLNKAEVLKPGDIKKIQFHHRFIHCAFHLHQPTCTLVIRTRRDNSVMPQMCYRGNEVAIGLDTPNLHNRHKLLFKMLKFADAMNTRIFEKALVDIVESLDLASLFVILFQIFPSLKSNYRALLTEELSRKGGNEILLRTLEEERRRRMLALGKNVFKDEKMRLILGSFAFLSDSEKRQAFLDEHLGNSWIDILERILNCSETENRSVFLEASLVLKAKLGEMRAISKTFNKDYAVI